jgi:hypothetical protein
MSVASVRKGKASDNAGYVNGAACERKYPQLTRVKLYRLVLVGEVRSILPPGSYPLYNLADLDRVMASGDALGKRRVEA